VAAVALPAASARDGSRRLAAGREPPEGPAGLGSSGATTRRSGLAPDFAAGLLLEFLQAELVVLLHLAHLLLHLQDLEVQLLDRAVQRPHLLLQRGDARIAACATLHLDLDVFFRRHPADRPKARHGRLSAGILRECRRA
jgi:hypothetical protein